MRPCGGDAYKRRPHTDAVPDGCQACVNGALEPALAWLWPTKDPGEASRLLWRAGGGRDYGRCAGLEALRHVAAAGIPHDPDPQIGQNAPVVAQDALRGATEADGRSRGRAREAAEAYSEERLQNAGSDGRNLRESCLGYPQRCSWCEPDGRTVCVYRVTR